MGVLASLRKSVWEVSNVIMEHSSRPDSLASFVTWFMGAIVLTRLDNATSRMA